MEAKRKIYNYQKNICDHKRIFCSYSLISPLASPIRKEKMRERKEERKKIYREKFREWGVKRQTKTEWILLTYYSTTLVFN